jgi:hypothetical protein
MTTIGIHLYEKIGTNNRGANLVIHVRSWTEIDREHTPNMITTDAQRGISTYRYSASVSYMDLLAPELGEGLLRR